MMIGLLALSDRTISWEISYRIYPCRENEYTAWNRSIIAACWLHIPHLESFLPCPPLLIPIPQEKNVPDFQKPLCWRWVSWQSRPILQMKPGDRKSTRLNSSH